MLDYFLQVIAPHVCIACAREGHILCAPCQKGLPLVHEVCYRCNAPTTRGLICKACSATVELKAVYGVTQYSGVAAELVQKLKFSRVVEAAKPMSAKIAAVISAQPNLLITHVPTATSRIRKRGYDQSALLARRIAKILGAEYIPLLLRKGQKRQLGSSGVDRRDQLRSAFEARVTIDKNRSILLIDDVLTTGSTMESACQALRTAGGRHISAAVFAVASNVPRQTSTSLL